MPPRSLLHRLLLLAVPLLATFPAIAASAGLDTLRIGYQKSSVNLLVARRLGLVEHHLPGVRLQWVEFSAGPQLLEALGAGSLDFGMTGDTPPIFAQAAGRDVLYVGRETPKPHSMAILVPPGSAISDLASLRGKRIAYQRGSSAHYLVLRALEKAGLRLNDVQTVNLAPADARAAFERHSIDAWAIWDPYWAAAATASHARVLVTGEGLADDVTFYEASQSFAKNHTAAISSLLDAINDGNRFVQAHPGEAAALVAADTGLNLQTARTFLERRQDSPVSSLNSVVIAGQQAIADAFVKEGVIPHQVKVADAVWRGGSAAAAGAAR